MYFIIFFYIRQQAIKKNIKKQQSLVRIAVFCLFLFPSISYAECDYQRTSELNKIASNVQFSYSYDVGDNNIPNIYLNISNITSDIYVEHFGDIYNSDVEHLQFEGFKTTKFNIFS